MKLKITKTITFLGHRKVLKRDIIKKRLLELLKEKIPQGYLNVLVGNHGEFDELALNCCLEFKKTIENLDITLVFTSLTILKKEYGYSLNDHYKRIGCKTMMYDIEEEYFKNQIVVSNRKMIDDRFDYLLC